MRKVFKTALIAAILSFLFVAAYEGANWDDLYPKLNSLYPSGTWLTTLSGIFDGVFTISMIVLVISGLAALFLWGYTVNLDKDSHSR